MDKKMSTKTQKAIAPKIQSAAADWYSQNFPSLNAGATFVLETFPVLYATTVHGMRGRFSLGELSIILDVLNGHATALCFGAAGLAGQSLVLSIQDSFEIYPKMYEEKWSITDPEGFVARLAALNRFQLVCLEIWAGGFWEKHHFDTPLEKYCAPLLS